MEEVELDLKQLFLIVIKRWWLMLLIPLVAAGITAYLSYNVLDPVYEANTTLYVINKQSENQTTIAQSDLTVSGLLVQDYKEIIVSRTVTQEVIDQLGLISLTTEELADKITVTAKNNTRILEIRVKDENPERAKNITDALASVFIERVVELMKVDNVSIVDAAVVPNAPVAPRPLRNTAIAAAAGLLLAIGAAFLLEFLDDTIKTSEDVEKHLGLTVLGTIPVFTLK